MAAQLYCIKNIAIVKTYSETEN